eukprot:2356997-Prymnesium_polylepis.2
MACWLGVRRHRSRRHPCLQSVAAAANDACCMCVLLGVPVVRTRPARGPCAACVARTAHRGHESGPCGAAGSALETVEKAAGQIA